MKITKLSALFAFAVMLSSPGFAQELLTKVDVIDHLDETARDCDWKARNLTGAPKIKMLMHKRVMDEVLEQLRAGRDVDPKDLEAALKVHAN